MAKLYLGTREVTPAIAKGYPGKYQLLQRISDDNDNEIGTVSGFFTDANDQEYAVVCLDAQYRLASGYYCDQSDYITNLPYYNRPTTSFWGNAKETATFNTQTILDWCETHSANSTACSHCRSNSFVIDEITYYGQLPQIIEMIDICCNMSAINTVDTSASSYSSLNFSSNRQFLTSTQCSSSYCWYFFDYAGIFYTLKSSGFFIAPVLELPNR